MTPGPRRSDSRFSGDHQLADGPEQLLVLLRRPDVDAHGTVFVGHELTARSRDLLESGTMDYVISHDFTAELAAAVRWLQEHRAGATFVPDRSPILVHTRYNCD